MTAYPDPAVSHIVRALTAERRAQGLSQKYIADHLGTGPSSIAHYESCRRTPRITFLQGYARLLGMELVLQLDPPPPTTPHGARP